MKTFNIHIDRRYIYLIATNRTQFLPMFSITRIIDKIDPPKYILNIDETVKVFQLMEPIVTYIEKNRWTHTT